uniref:Phospholipase A2 n=1 Tax=Strongyloides stercoralis TaxID=6248 RepID=A0A0K0E0S0_STRER
MERHKWQCGTSVLDKFLAFKVAHMSCTTRQISKINDCCTVHDSCYEKKKLSKEKCDTLMQDCFEAAVSVETGSKRSTCRALMDGFEAAVDLFGDSAYGNAK